MTGMSVLNAIKLFLKKIISTADKTCVPADGEAHTVDEGKASGPWIGVDLDGTLAVYERSPSPGNIGTPVPMMMERVRLMLANGERVKIFTARANDPGQLPKIRAWLEENGLPPLEITSVKDYNMLRLYDDRCIQVETNTGRLITAGEPS